MNKEQLGIVEINAELGAGTRGSSAGIQAIKSALINQGSTLFQEYPSSKLWIDNDALFHKTETPCALRIKDYQQVFKRIQEHVEMQVAQKNKLIFLTGDHASAAGILKGIRKANQNRKLGIIWIDAHADLHSPFTSPSGNIHGMPLAITLEEDNLSLQQNKPKEETVEIWQQLKNKSFNNPKPPIFFIGLRDFEREEQALIEKYQFPVVPVKEVQNTPIQTLIDNIESYFEECDDIYVSFDVDSMDPLKVSDGTGTPVPNGLDLEQSILLVSNILKHIPKARYFEITEVNPILDTKGNKMGEAAAQILESALSAFKKTS